MALPGAATVGLQGIFDLTGFAAGLKGYMDGLKQVTTGTSEVAASASEASKPVTDFFLRVGEIVAGLTVTKVLGEITDAIRDMGQAAMEKEVMLTRLNASIISTGGAAGLSTSDVLDLADKYRLLFGGADDAAIAVEQIGIQMGSVTADEMPAFLQMVADLGAAMGSTEAAATALAFAQESPTASLRRFRDANILFSVSERDAIKAMEDAGNVAGAYALILDKVARATGGQAAAQAQTLTGQWRIFTNTLQDAAATIGMSFLPAAEALFQVTLGQAIPVVHDLSIAFADLVTQITTGDTLQGFTDFHDAVASSLGQTAADAETWGQNIIVSLANGIINGIGAVFDALAAVGNLISSWLSPGSPPKLLPDLPDWGQNVINQFLSGWNNADASVFTNLSGTFESFFRSLGKSAVGEVDLAPLIAQMRSQVADAVSSFASGGTVNMDSLLSGLGPMSGALRGYAEALFAAAAADEKVTVAQKELDDATQKYADLLKPVDAAIDKIDEAQQQLADTNTKSMLALVLKDPNASVSEKRRAQLAIDKIDAEARKRKLVGEQKAVIDTATLKLNAAKKEQTEAQDRLAFQKMLLDAQMQGNKLIDEQIKLMERLAKAAEAAAKAGSAGKVGGGAAKLAGLGGAMPGGGLADLPNPQDMINKFLAKWDAFIAPLKKKWEEVKAAWMPVFTWMQGIYTTYLAPVLQGVSDWVTAHKDEILAFFLGFAGTLLAVAAAGLLLDGVVALLGVLAGIVTFLLSPLGLLALAVGILAAAWVGNWGDIQGKTAEVWAWLQPILQSAWDWLMVQLPIALQTLSTFWTGTLLPAITSVWTWVTGTFLPMLQTLWDWVMTKLPGAITFLQTAWNTLWTALTAFWGWLNTVWWPFLASMANLLTAVLVMAVTGVKEIFEDLWILVLVPFWDFLTTKLQVAFKALNDFLVDHFGVSLADISKAINETFLGALKGLWTFITDKFQSALDGINQRIKDITGFFNTLAAALNSFTLPSWMIGHSPSPLEKSLMGIGEAFAVVTDRMHGLRLASIALTGSGPRTVGGTTHSVSNNTYLNYSPTYGGSPSSVTDNFATLQALYG